MASKLVNARFDPTDYRRWMSKATALKTFAVVQKEVFPRINAYQYKNEVSRVISTQNFYQKMPALSFEYRKWKIEHGFPSSIGILKRDLLSNIIVLKEGVGAYYSGVDPTAHDEGRKNWYLNGAPKRIITYAIWLEEGRPATKTGGPQPPRPIFMSTARWYESNKWLKNNETMLNLMKRIW